MYRGHGFNEWGIGDVDVVKVGDTYHLFHLYLPNHAYIAHAVSKDGLSWTRVRNALFVGDPGAWDDDMLWTMHVSPDPDKPGAWRMFYTGLARREYGRVQRVGLAVSDDLYTWRKVTRGFPLSIPDEFYEASINEDRGWVSFRDPYFCQVNGERWMLAAGRVNSGPVVRRGCVALMKETEPLKFEFRPPLHHPHRYDDIEVPVLFSLDGQWYLLGSIREDVKIHYWHAQRPEGPFLSFSDNVLLPQGNYAARICNEGERLTLWNFFFLPAKIKGTGNMLLPPKELVTNKYGELKLKSFSGFDQVVTRTLPRDETMGLEQAYDLESAGMVERGRSVVAVCEEAFEMFLHPEPLRNFRLRCTFELQGAGKCGLVLRMNSETDGYYISFDLLKGVLQARASGRNPGGYLEESFIHQPLQANFFVAKRQERRYELELIAYGQYFELSLDGYVLMTFADDRYAEGHVGYYSAGARLKMDNIRIEELAEPSGELHVEAPLEFGPADAAGDEALGGADAGP